jgi:hypothetical protein
MVGPKTIAALGVTLLPIAVLWAWSANRRLIAERGWQSRVSKNAYRVGLLCLGSFVALMVF